MVATAPQVPRWFISHWWGEPVCLFVTCVERHGKLRHLPKDSPYWVCAYANNQWNLGTDVTSDPAETSFRKAMALSEGTLSILDADGVVFQRIWCGFEIATTLRQDSQKLYDLATVIENDSAVIITDGLTLHDKFAGERYGPDYRGGPRGYKTRRERRFPLALAEKALSVRVESGVASVDSDRIHILNSIAGIADLESKPLANCTQYEQVNAVLHGRFAAALYRVALEKRWPKLHDALQPALACFPCADLALPFYECEELDNQGVKSLLSTLPPAMQRLELDLTFCSHLTSSGLKASRFAHLTQLSNLSINFARCWNITNLDMMKSFAALGKLRQLSLDFNMCLNLENVSGLQKLAALPSLAAVSLDFSSCSALTDFSSARFSECSFTELSLDFTGSAISTGLVRELFPSSLTSLRMRFLRCLQMKDLSFLEHIANAQSLQELSLDFGLCQRVELPSQLRRLADLRRLSSLHVNFRGCPRVPQQFWHIDTVEKLRSSTDGEAGICSSSSIPTSVMNSLCSDIVATFRKFDADGDGLISRAEMKSLFCKLKFTEGDTDTLFDAIDTNKDRMISYHEFVNWLVRPDESTQNTKTDTATDEETNPFGQKSIFIGNVAEEKEPGARKKKPTWAWTFYIRGDVDSIELVTIYLHETFANSVQKLRPPLLERTFYGWGTFPIQVHILWKHGGELRTTWELQFHADACKHFEVPSAVNRADAIGNREVSLSLESESNEDLTESDPEEETTHVQKAKTKAPHARKIQKKSKVAHKKAVHQVEDEHLDEASCSTEMPSLKAKAPHRKTAPQKKQAFQSKAPPRKKVAPRSKVCHTESDEEAEADCAGDLFGSSDSDDVPHLTKKMPHGTKLAPKSTESYAESEEEDEADCAVGLFDSSDSEDIPRAKANVSQSTKLAPMSTESHVESEEEVGQCAGGLFDPSDSDDESIGGKYPSKNNAKAPRKQMAARPKLAL
eukprot:TRINITY_DN47107_c0_g1_i2.p1 TRINITY_DN47107_c0_g1~~TRINITY_DN47107_c0_g1_i2.p1  ORF type:complete len:1081 (+),score=138.48 TRINITY_DN47107_c0_g1_i2:349-3243(+)